ncbi:Uncharacterised protein [Mycobacterium tuberculosis]|nr:Uncharacterised protein [Mycobacterium tuberculosis]
MLLDLTAAVDSGAPLAAALAEMRGEGVDLVTGP